MTSLGVTARQTGFRALDRLRGGQIRRHLADIDDRMSGGEGHDLQLQRLLTHATRTTSFYRPYSGAALEDYPVVRKVDYRNRTADFASSVVPTRSLRYVVTTGSTGVPITIAQDPVKRQRNVADVIYFNERVGYRLGERLMWVHNWTDATEKNWLTRTLQNVEPVRIIGLDDPVRARILDSLRRGRIQAILGYSSALLGLARFIEDRGGGGFGLHVVTSDSETMLPKDKQRMERAFGCPVVDRYANNENGILAITMPNDDRFHLNRGSYRFEFLKLGADEPEAPGKLARCVVTDLYNFATPLIRYDTGDLVIANDDGRTLSRLDGRQADVIYSTTGLELSSTSVAFAMEAFQGIDGYQVEQTGPGQYQVRIAKGSSAYTEAQVASTLAKTLGLDARIEVEFVPRIETEPGRKVRPVIRSFDP